MIGTNFSGSLNIFLENLYKRIDINEIKNHYQIHIPGCAGDTMD